MSVNLLVALVAALTLGGAFVMGKRRGARPKPTGSGNWTTYENADGSPLAMVEQPGSPGRYTLMLDHPGQTEVRVIKQVRIITGLGILPAKLLAQNVPSRILTQVDHDTARQAYVKLTDAGATARITER